MNKRDRSCRSKNRYRDLQTAEFVAYRCMCERPTCPLLSAYPCRYCGGYHLTSKRQR